VIGIEVCHFEIEGVKSWGVLPTYCVPSSCSWEWRSPRQQSHMMEGVDPQVTPQESCQETAMLVTG